MKLFPLVICLLINGSLAFVFKTIDQKEIVDYIKNRADLLHGNELSKRNLQDLLSYAVFTGLEEETLNFAYGSSGNSGLGVGQLPDQLSVLTTTGSPFDEGPLKIFLTSDNLGTTNIALDGLTTTRSSSSKSSGGFVVNCLKQAAFDSTFLDGLITINLIGETDSNNLTLTRTIDFTTEVNVTSLGSNWESSLLINEGKLLSMLNPREGTMYIVTYQSLIRETIQANEGDLFGGLKSSGKVLVVLNSDGEVSLSGRTISSKIGVTRDNKAGEFVDQFLTIDGQKSRFRINDFTKANSSPFELVKNWLYSQIGHHGSGSFKRGDQKGNSHSGHRHGGSRDETRGVKRHGRGWKSPCQYKSTWPSWKLFWDFDDGFGFKTWDSWEGFFGDCGPGRHEHKPESTTSKPVKITEHPQTEPSSTPSSIETDKPVVTNKVEPEIEVTTVNPKPENPETIRPTMKPEEEPDYSEPDFTGLPKGTTVSIWSTRII